ncbi:MAG: helix-turn-helix domain-containing protein [Elusimicrobia bacterium]|nr:helix-turn-helix domain-containing protein [Elusimicrobiota bacterium]
MKAEWERARESGWAKFFHVIVDSGVWAQLSPKAQAVYVVLLRHTSDEERRCWPSNKLIAREAGIHVRTVTAALAELVRSVLIKKWRLDRKNFYKLYRGEELKSLLPEKMDVSTSPQKMDINTPKRRRDACGRFTAPCVMEQPTPDSMDRPKPPSVEAVHPSAVEPKKSSLRRDIEEEKEKKSTAGSAAASSKASAEPAAAAREYIEYLIPGKLTRNSFYYNQRMNKAHKKPTPEQIRWLKTCVRLTDEELQALFAAEYPDWKPAHGNGAG